MKKRIKIVLYCILWIILIITISLMSWWRKFNAWEPDATLEELIWEDWSEIENNSPKIQPSQSFEEDVMNDLEDLFNNSNGYENIEWEFWFTNIDE